MRPVHIEGGRALIDGAFADAGVTVADGAVATLGGARPAGALTLDARGLLVLPGIVDVHGDAFERQLMPRPGVRFDTALALADTDRQLAASGITTAYHGLTLSWEPGLRSLDAGRAFMDGLAAARPGLRADHRVQLRWETFALDAEDAVAAWLGSEPRPALAFNDHTTSTADKLAAGRHAKIGEWASRAGLSVDGYVAEFRAAWARAPEVDGAVARLAGRAAATGAVVLSHDDRTHAERARYRALGARVAEFPLALEAAEDARAHGEHTVFGAPNVVRGGSHTGALDAAEMVAAGLCSILASDYHYPSLPAAVGRLAAGRGVALEAAWALVSAAPAEAMRLADRGRIAPGLRADIVLARATPDGRLAVEATIAAGRLIHLADHAVLAA